jgi:hypothetical protein
VNELNKQTLNSSSLNLPASDFLRESTDSAVKIWLKNEKMSGASGDDWTTEINEPYQQA